MASWHVYILRCADDSLYTGIARDVEKRLDEHNRHDRKAAKYTRARRPVELVYVEPCISRSAACKREAQIKAMRKAAKHALIRAHMRKQQHIPDRR